MKTVLVTGGAGFIGSCLVRRLIADTPFRVINYDKLTYAGNLKSLVSVMNEARHVFVQGDICDRSILEHVLSTYKPQALLHLAAESHVDRSIAGPVEFFRTNIQGTFELLEAVLSYSKNLSAGDFQAFRLINVSTDEVYGSLGPEGFFSESSSYAPNNPYSASKASADHLARAYYHTYGLPTISTHCSNNYGPCQSPEKLIPLMILNARNGLPLPVYGDGNNIRDWLFVDDHVSALCRVLEAGKPGEVYNIGGGCERTNVQVVEAICKNLERLCPDLPPGLYERLVQFVPDRPGHDRRYALDCSKITRELNWSPHESFESGLERTVRWYLENPDWVQSCSKLR